MKLTNISLAVLVALGLVACGGSDDNKNQTTDNQNAGHQTGGNGGAGGAGGAGTPTPPKKEVEDPNNKSSGLEVEKRYETNTAVAKTIYANRSGMQTLSGYVSPDASGTANVFAEGSVSTPDILRASSAVNYLSEGWVNLSGTIRLNPYQTYAKGKNGNFYRVSVINGGLNWDRATPSSTFVVTGDTAPELAKQFDDPNNVPATNIWFVPNVMSATGGPGNNPNQAVVIPPATLGSLQGRVSAARAMSVNRVNTKNISGNVVFNNDTNAFDTAFGDVVPVGVTVGDKDYSFSGASSSAGSYKLDLNLDRATKIQTLPIKYNYSIIDTKSTSNPSDDDSAVRTTDAGELRVYNVNYSLALLEVNDAAAKDSNDVNAAARNGLGFGGGSPTAYINGYGNVSGSGLNGRYGPFQVQGFQTQALPLNGRATYRGQSFGVNSKGKLDLSVDFGEERAAIGGSVTERTTVDGKKPLPDMKLNNIYLSQPSRYSVTGSMGLDSTSPAVNGVVDLGGQTNWGTWAVQLYGPNAENAAGVIARDVVGPQPYGGGVAPGAPTAAALNNVVEVFDSIRTDINPKSLNNQKNP